MVTLTLNTGQGQSFEGAKRPDKIRRINTDYGSNLSFTRKKNEKTNYISEQILRLHAKFRENSPQSTPKFINVCTGLKAIKKARYRNVNDAIRITVSTCLS